MPSLHVVQIRKTAGSGEDFGELLCKSRMTSRKRKKTESKLIPYMSIRASGSQISWCWSGKVDDVLADPHIICFPIMCAATVAEPEFSKSAEQLMVSLLAF